MSGFIRSAGLAGTIVLGCLTAFSAFAAEKVVQVGGGLGLLDQPGKARGSLILMPGGDGDIGLGADGQIARPGNTLVRERKRFAAAGFATLTLDEGTDPAQAVNLMRGIAKPVVVIAMSKAATRVGPALGARPDGLIFVSAMLDDFRLRNSPESLPPTLVLHHREDTCRVTLPPIVDTFLAWASNRAKVQWFTGGVVEGNPCLARGHHGFAGIESQMVAAATRFAARPR